MIRPASGPIHLDTSFLIRALDPSGAESRKLFEWLGEHQSIAISSVAWSEFLCGPLSDAERDVARAVVQRHVPLGVDEATEAALLFNLGGRRRHSLPDCLIAATAILDGAVLATSNPKDFERFADARLELAE